MAARFRCSANALSFGLLLSLLVLVFRFCGCRCLRQIVGVLELEGAQVHTRRRLVLLLLLLLLLLHGWWWRLRWWCVRRQTRPTKGSYVLDELVELSLLGKHY